MHNHIPLNIPLPQCQGPKLQPFCKGKPQIDFLRRLSATDEAIHSHVFEVLIDGQVYALKLVDVYNCSRPLTQLTPSPVQILQ